MSQLRIETRLPRYADQALRRARLVVVPDRVEAPARAPFVALVVLLLAGGVAGLLAFNTSMQQASFHATALAKQASDLTARKQSLAMALAARRDPQQLAARAKALGMVVPPDPAFVRLSDGAVLGTPTPAVADDSMRINPLPAGKPAALDPTPLIVKVPAPPVVAPVAPTTATTTTTGTNQTDLPVASVTSTQAGGVKNKSHQPRAHHKKGQGTPQ